MFCGISLGTCSHPALLHVLPFAGIPLCVVGACLHVRPPERVLWVEGPVRCLRGWLVQQSLPLIYAMCVCVRGRVWMTGATPHTYTHTHTHTHAYMYIQVYIHTCAHTYITGAANAAPFGAAAPFGTSSGGFGAPATATSSAPAFGSTGGATGGFGSFGATSAAGFGATGATGFERAPASFAQLLRRAAAKSRQKDLGKP